MLNYFRQTLSFVLLFTLMSACAPTKSENSNTENKDAETNSHPFFTVDQLKTVHALFPQGLTPLYASGQGFEPNTMSMGIHQQKEESFLRLSYGKSNPSGQMSVLKIEHYSKEQILQKACKRREEKAQIEHELLGPLTICKNHIRENIIGARILQPASWPGHLNIQFSGPQDDLQHSIQSLSPGAVLNASETEQAQSFQSLLRQHVPEPGLLYLDHPEYKSAVSQLNWSAYDSDITATTSYTRAISFSEESITLHFVVSIHYGPQRQMRNQGQCGNRDFSQSYEHPELGPFLLCINENRPDLPKLKYISKLKSYLALVYPLKGNKLQHIYMRIDGFPDEMEEILKSLRLSG